MPCGSRLLWAPFARIPRTCSSPHLGVGLVYVASGLLERLLVGNGFRVAAMIAVECSVRSSPPPGSSQIVTIAFRFEIRHNSSRWQYVKRRIFRGLVMERLGQRDLEVFLSFLREIYADPDLESFAALPKLVPSEWTSYNEVNPRSQTITWTTEPFPSDFLEGVPVFEQHIPEHHLIDNYQQTRDGQALKISDFLTQGQYHGLGL